MGDNFESRMEFIIEQQAQFTVDIQLLKERQAETREMIRQLVDVTMSLAHHGEETDRRLQEIDRQFLETDRRLRESGEQTDQRLRELAESGEQTDQRLRELAESGEQTDRRLRELAEAGAHADRRLDALIDTVDKLARGPVGGGQQAEGGRQ